jgi:large subunit ribosomal protein L29|uniref:Large ribosomal subunit protein uL29c n=1 Tax=Guillardia theta TaxID=55529 RepID=A0A0U2L6D0_GUITH|nr:ribosomal protein L29 [Guillardia theta]|tara:strand:+ start:14173 stop:14379 length:207 start_codon:yes stop_codon:yes gene_type:complete
MALSNFQDLKELDNNKIEDEIINSKKELFNLRLQRATRQSFKSHNFKHLKHKVAQLLTLETQRKQNIN